MEHKQNSNIDRIISRKEFAELTGMSRTSIWRGIKNGDLPATVVINNRVLGFLESDYLCWLDKHTQK